MKKLLILGGFPQMIDIVMTAREMGIYTVVADISPTSSAKRFADKSYDVSTDRIDELTAICEREGIDGVFTGFEDFNIHIAERLCQILGLPFYATREQLAVITDKIRFKAKCRECGVPTVPEYALDEALEAGKYP